MDMEEFKNNLTKEELEFFEKLAPSYKKNLFSYGTSGKKEDTKLKNLEEVKEALSLKCKTIFDYKKKINPKKDIPKNLDDKSKIKLYFDKVEEAENRKIISNLYFDIIENHPTLKELYAWNQPMIQNNETFICGFSVAKNHFTIAFDSDTLEFFKEQFESCEYEILKKCIKIKWNQTIYKDLILEAVRFTIENKKDAKGFWK